MSATDFGRFLPRLILLVILLVGAGCDLQGDYPLQSVNVSLDGYIGISEDIKKILPNGTILYYAKVYRKLGTQKDHWYIESLDIQTGKTRILFDGDLTGFSQTLPFSITKDGKFLLAKVRLPDSDRKALIEISTSTKRWRVIKKDVFGGDYSPNGDKIVIYYPVNPDKFYNDKRMHVAIIDKNGVFIKRIPCDGIRCYHANWTNEGNAILYIESSSTSTSIVKHIIASNKKKYLYSSPNSHTKFYYPMECNLQTFFLTKQKNHTDKMAAEDDRLVMLAILHQHSVDHSTTIQPTFIESSRYTKYRCLKGISNYLIGVHDGGNDHPPTDSLNISLFNIRHKNRYRITPGPTLETSYLSPVVYTPPQNQEPIDAALYKR